MQSANLSGPLKGLRPYQALIGPTQASGLAGGFDYAGPPHSPAPAGGVGAGGHKAAVDALLLHERVMEIGRASCRERV